MLRILKIIPFVLILSGCGGGLSFLDKAKDQSKVTVQVRPTTLPYLINVPHPVAPILDPTPVDKPRDLSKGKIVKDLPECKTNLRDTNFEKNCMEFPIIPNTNIYAGFTVEGFKNHLNNQAKIDAYIQQYKNRVDEVNKERETWRQQGTQ